MLKYAFISEAGCRPINEDSIRIATVANKHCFVVCDGLGGHDRGDVASDLVANTFADHLCFAEDLEAFLSQSFNRAQEGVLQKQAQLRSQSNMKTTAVVLATDGTTGYVGHIGDSRFYGFTNDGHYVRTLDHSIPQLLVNTQTIAETDIRNHPSRNMLLKVIGEEYDDAMADFFAPFPLQDYRAFLLCSDGFWELIEESEMIALLNQSSTPQAWLDAMTDLVKRNGAGKKMDNFSAIAIFNRD